MYKINEAVIGKNQQIVGSKVLTFRLDYIKKYFADIEFLNKELVKTQVFAFSRFKKQTSKSS